LAGTDGRWAATLAHRVSCPTCNEALILPEGVQAGDAVECCGRRHRLTFEYGAFAAEEAQEARTWRDRAGEGEMMGLGAFKAGLVAGVGAGLSSLCCLLPLAIIVSGLGSGAFMAVTMPYRWLLIPAGVVGVGVGFVLYARERRRCDALACRMVGRRIMLTLLIVASLVVATSIALDQFPDVTSALLARLTDGPATQPAGHDMKDMGREVRP
jgi:hypothetical protein